MLTHATTADQNSNPKHPVTDYQKPQSVHTFLVETLKIINPSMV
jgi:hypothetical protein